MERDDTPGEQMFDKVKLLGTRVTRITLYDNKFTNNFVNILYIPVCREPSEQ
jgi:hypothetical protein